MWPGRCGIKRSQLECTEPQQEVMGTSGGFKFTLPAQSSSMVSIKSENASTLNDQGEAVHDGRTDPSNGPDQLLPS